MSFNITFVLFPNFEELDFVGPYEYGPAPPYADVEPQQVDG